MRLLTLLLLPAALLAGPSRYARLGDFQGPVEVQLTAADPWIPAERNLPLTQSAWVRTGRGARLEIELDDGGAWRLGPDSQGEISDYTRLSTGQRITLLSLDHGSAYFSGQPAGKDVVMLVMPGTQLTVMQGSRIRETAQAAWSQVAVLEGKIRFSSPSAEMDVREGTTARVEPTHPSRFFLYPEVTVEALDEWSENRDRLQSAPASAAYVTARYGLTDLDSGGKWVPTRDLGLVWKPAVAEDWAPYQKGYWRYFESLGYTWVSGDSWGWLPYHNGRWTRKEDLGWVWQPAVSTVFRPGEVYWQSGAGFAGWGPLAPGEIAGAAAVPQAYAAGTSTYAAFHQDARILDATGFAAPSPEQLKSAVFVTALPSPAFPMSSLDATRPVLKVGSTRVIPSVYGVTFGDGPPPDSSTDAGSDLGSDRIVRRSYALPATGATDDAPVTEVPVIVPWPVVVNERAKPTRVEKTGTTPATTATAAPAPVHTRSPEPAPKDPKKGIKPPADFEFFRQVREDVAQPAPNFVKALADLDAWTSSVPDTGYKNDRAYYYVHVYNGMGRAGKVLDAAAPLVTATVAISFADPQQALQVLVDASSSLPKVVNPTSFQITTGLKASRQLLDFLPSYFTSSHKPADVTDAAWTAARIQLEMAAKRVLAKYPAASEAVKANR